MSTTTNTITAKELWARSEEPLELLRGKLVEVMSPAGSKHGILMRRLAWLLENQIQSSGQGEAYAGDVGFLLSRDPDTVLAPDVAYVSQAKLNQLTEPHNYLPFAPDIAIEIISPHDTLTASAAKAQEYLRYGVAMVIVVNPRKHQLTVHRPGQAVVELNAPEPLDCGEVAAGLIIDTAMLFKDL